MPLNSSITGLTGATTQEQIGNVGDAMKVTGTGATDVATITRTDVNAAVVTTTSNTSAFETNGFGTLNWNVAISAASGTTPKLDVQLQASDDNINWASVHDSKRFTTSPDTFRLQGTRFAGKYYRFAYTVSGASASFTVTIVTVLKAYLPSRTASLFRYSDINTTANSNLSTAFNAGSCENIAVQIVRPADGKAAVKLRLQASIDGLFYDDITADVSIVTGTTTIQTLSGQAFRFYRWKVTAKVDDSQAPDIYWHANGGG